MCPLLKWARTLKTKDMEKTNVLNSFSVFTVNTCLHQSQVPETTWKMWSGEDLPSAEDDQIREYVNKLEVHKSMGPNGKYPQVLVELTEVIIRPLMITSEWS